MSVADAERYDENQRHGGHAPGAHALRAAPGAPFPRQAQDARPQRDGHAQARRYPRITVVHECPHSALCAGYDRGVCPIAGVVAEVPETVLVCPVDTYVLHARDGRGDADE